MSTATIAEVRALVATGLSDPDLQPVIDREESYLARELGAPIAGERIQQVWRSRLTASFDDIHLARPTDALTTVTDNGVTIDPADVRLLAAGTIAELVAGSWSGPLVELTYTPNDVLQVIRVVIELCRLTLGETGFNSEDIGDYRYQRSGILQATATQIQAASRKALVRTLLVSRSRPGTIHLQPDLLERIGA